MTSPSPPSQPPVPPQPLPPTPTTHSPKPTQQQAKKPRQRKRADAQKNDQQPVQRMNIIFLRLHILKKLMLLPSALRIPTRPYFPDLPSPALPYESLLPCQWRAVPTAPPAWPADQPRRPAHVGTPAPISLPDEPIRPWISPTVPPVPAYDDVPPASPGHPRTTHARFFHNEWEAQAQARRWSR
jgi:hypothetical protein